MQRAILPALSLSALALALPSASRAQSLDAGVPFDAATFGIVPPPPPPPPPPPYDAAVPEAAPGDGGIPLVVPAPAEVPIDVGAETPIDVGAEAPIDVGTRTLGGGTSGGAIDVTVRSRAKEARRLQRSAEAVTVVDLQKAQQRSADLGEVLARTQGVTLRRSGGLGSTFRFFLNGLTDDQIRYFYDNIPVETAGFALGVADIPVNLLDRVEVYRAVLPVRFGVDALGGAVNFVTDRDAKTGGDFSYQFSSFHTHRATLRARYVHEPSGFFVNADGFFDDTDNDYKVDVEVPDATGRLSPARVKRTHDAYRAYGGFLETGVVDRRWAKRLTVRGYYTGYDKELQNNIVMTVPYGEVEYGERLGGVTARYEQPLSEQFDLEVVAAFARNTIDFQDKASWVYDWYGRRVRERRVPGEIDGDATDQTNWQNSVFTRALLRWKPSPQHVLLGSVTPQWDSRTGDERIQADPTARDPLTADRELTRVVSGLEYEYNAVHIDRSGDELPLGAEEDRRTLTDADPYTGFRLQNKVFVKSYVYRANSEEPLPGNIFRSRDKSTNEVGFGDTLRYTFSKWLLAKASYEYAVRLPRPDEVFGNGVLISSNLQLEPEVSHNANIGPTFDLKRSKIGSVYLDVGTFLRNSDKLILLLGNDRYWAYQNVYKARSVGLEGTFAWVSPGRYVNIDGSMTWQEMTNQSTKGTFAAYKGDRIPNRPYMMAAWGGGLRFGRLLHDGDALEPFYSGRYVHSFYRGWESQGLKQFKQVIPTQITHGIGLTYSVDLDFARFSGTLEVQNLTDARVYDLFGSQRPGRYYGFKLTGRI